VRELGRSGTSREEEKGRERKGGGKVDLRAIANPIVTAAHPIPEKGGGGGKGGKKASKKEGKGKRSPRSIFHGYHSNRDGGC